MVTPLTRVGNNPFFRNNVGRTNTQGLTGNQLQDFMRQPLRNWEREILRQPLRPSQDRRMPSPIPKIPYKVEKQAQQRAWQIAQRIVKAGTRLHPFRLVFQWLLEWLLDWLRRQYQYRRAAASGWTLVASCGSPPTPVAPDRFLGHSLYPPPAVDYTQTTSCLTGQAIGPSYPYSLSAMSRFDRTAKKHTVYSLVPERATITELWTRPGGYLPNIWELPDINVDTPPYVPPPPPVRRHMKDNWKDLIDNKVPEDKTPPAKEPDDVPISREDTKQIIFNYDRGVRVQTKEWKGQRTRQRTRTREKEKKFAGSSQTVRAIFGWLSRNKERLTEFDDFLDILIDSMPKDIQDKMPKRNGRGTPDLKAKHIYDNFDKIDWSKFADEFVKNWLEDKVVGTAIAGSDKAAKARGESSTIGSRAWLHSSTKGQMPWFPK